MRRILFVSCNYASDYGVMVWGTYIRMRMLLEAATRAAGHVDLLLFVAPGMIDSAERDSVAASLKQHWQLDVTVHVAPRSMAAHGGRLSTLRGLFDLRFQEDYGHAGGEEQRQAVTALLKEDTELVIAHRLDAALACVPAARGRVPVALNFDDVEHVVRRRRLLREPASLKAWMRRMEVRAIKAAEVQLLAEVQCAMICSTEELGYLRDLGVGSHIEVLHNAVFFPPLGATRQSAGNTIMFIGSYGYDPNIEAAEELITKIFPRIRQRVPDARLLIAGARSERLPSAKIADEAIRILGYIDDVATIYGQADVACCAIRAGGGTRIKIIEAAAWQVPTVSTRLGAEGLDLDDGTEVLLAESSNALADACIDLLLDPQRAAAVGSAARRRMVRDYEHDAVVDRIAEVYRRTGASAGRAIEAAPPAPATRA